VCGVGTLRFAHHTHLPFDPHQYAAARLPI